MSTRSELVSKVTRIDYWGARVHGAAKETAGRIVDRLIQDGDLAPGAPSLREVVEDDIEVLLGVGCQFFACQGPDPEPVDAVTCRVCWRVHDLRDILTKITLDQQAANPEGVIT